MVYLAHVNAEDLREQSVLVHLKGTAERASQFAEAFSVGELGYFCGMLHDIGKYSQKFQRRIRGSNETADHATAGAKVAMDEYENVPAAFCIAGHHTGLPDCGNRRIATPDDPTFFGKMSRKVGEDIEEFNAFRSEVTVTEPLPIPKKYLTNPQSQVFFIRMLYSCLVDADYLDTEAFMTNRKTPRGDKIFLHSLLEKLERHIDPWWNTDNELNQKRCEILKTCIEAGEQERGLFTLTVPTGGGKTISSMAFALRHALSKALKRVIYVIPYTSIIEQTQQVFEEIFGKEHVVAHYANLEYSTDESRSIKDKRYLATENWDAPIILTTSVQFFESLYANRSTRCRKLHNIVNSVIIFDEAQMLPVPYLKPCIAAMTQLIQNYGCSAVLCTATQPALNPLFQKQNPKIQIQEIYPQVSALYTHFQRVTYRQIGKLSDEALAERLNGEKQVLCIVNSRKQAQTIYRQLEGEGSYHLSTTMYPAHRRKVLDEIRDRLDEKLPCRVVSTSLVEAGVDVDFPAVYRALAGLDSMIQAGGRCNREGKRAIAQSIVSLFETDQKPPPILEQNISSAERVMKSYEDISSPEAVAAYFDFLYYKLKDEKELDKKQILTEIDRGTFPFAAIAEKFRMIEGAVYIVYIPLEEGGALIRQWKEYGPNRSLIRKLGQYGVSVYSDHFRELHQIGAIEQLGDYAGVLCDLTIYREETGLLFHGNEGQSFMV